MVKITTETLQELFTNRLKEWSKIRGLSEQEFTALENYLHQLAFCYEGCEKPADPNLIVDEVFFNRCELIEEFKERAC